MQKVIDDIHSGVTDEEILFDLSLNLGELDPSLIYQAACAQRVPLTIKLSKKYPSLRNYRDRRGRTFLHALGHSFSPEVLRVSRELIHAEDRFGETFLDHLMLRITNAQLHEIIRFGDFSGNSYVMEEIYNRYNEINEEAWEMARVCDFSYLSEFQRYMNLQIEVVKKRTLQMELGREVNFEIFKELLLIRNNKLEYRDLYGRTILMTLLESNSLNICSKVELVLKIKKPNVIFDYDFNSLFSILFDSRTKSRVKMRLYEMLKNYLKFEEYVEAMVLPNIKGKNAIEVLIRQPKQKFMRKILADVIQETGNDNLSWLDKHINMLKNSDYISILKKHKRQNYDLFVNNKFKTVVKSFLRMKGPVLIAIKMNDLKLVKYFIHKMKWKLDQMTLNGYPLVFYSFKYPEMCASLLKYLEETSPHCHFQKDALVPKLPEKLFRRALESEIIFKELLEYMTSNNRFGYFLYYIQRSKFFSEFMQAQSQLVGLLL